VQAAWRGCTAPQTRMLAIAMPSRRDYHGKYCIRDTVSQEGLGSV
jgi:hypothetical protein